MRVRESMHLIYAKDGEYDHGQRIGPEFVHPEAGYQQGFRQTVSDQIDRSEFPATVRERLGPMEKMRDKLFVIFARQVQQHDKSEEFIHGARFDEPDQHTADAFEETVESLDRNSGLETLIEE